MYDDSQSIDKSAKTNPLYNSGIKIKTHNRTKSDAIIRNPKLLHKFIEDAKFMHFIEHHKVKIQDKKLNIGKSSSKNLIDSCQFKNRFKQSFSAKKNQKRIPEREEINTPSEPLEIIPRKDFDITNKTDIGNTITHEDVFEYKSADREITNTLKFKTDTLTNHSVFDDTNQFFSDKLKQEIGADKIKLLCTINAHIDTVNRLEVTNDSTLATFSNDGSIKLWNMKGSKHIPLIAEIKTFRHNYGPLLSSTSANNFIFGGDTRGYISVFKQNWNEYEYFRTFKSGPEPVWSLSFNSTNQLLASTNPSKLKLWDVNQVSAKTEHCALSTNSKFLGSCEWHSKSDLIIYSYDNSYLNNEFIFLDIHKNQEKSKISQLSTFANQFIIAREHILLSANENNTVSMYDLRTGKLLQEFIAHSDNVSAIKYDDSRGLLMTGSSDSSLRLWDIRNLRCIQEFTLHKKKYHDSIFDITYCKQLNLIMTAGADATVRFFQLP